MSKTKRNKVVDDIYFKRFLKKIGIVVAIFGLILIILSFLGDVFFKYTTTNSTKFLWNQFFTCFIGIAIGFWALSLILICGIKKVISFVEKMANGIPMILKIIPYFAFISITVIMIIAPIMSSIDAISILQDIKNPEQVKVVGIVTNDIKSKETTDFNDHTNTSKRAIYFIPDGKSEDDEEVYTIYTLLSNWDYKGEHVEITRWKHSKYFISIEIID